MTLNSSRLLFTAEMVSVRIDGAVLVWLGANGLVLP